jgi:hypothetical protein
MRDYRYEFAIQDKIHKLFNMPQKPSAETWQGWEAYEKAAQESSKIGSFLCKVVSMYFDAFEMIIDVLLLKSVRRYVNNYRVKSHTMHMSKTKIGQWSDISTRIPDAIFTTLIWFVEHECVQMQYWCDKNKGIDKLVKHNPELRENIGLDWLEFQREHTTESGKSDYDKLIAAYKYAKYEWGTTDPYATFPIEGTEKEKSDAVKLIRKLEEEIRDTETMHLKNVIELRDYLWT